MTILSTFIAFDAVLRDVCSPMQLRHIAAEVEALAKACAAADREMVKLRAEASDHRVFLAKWHRRFNESAPSSAAPHVDGPRAVDLHAASGGADVHEAVVVPLKLAPSPVDAEQPAPPPPGEHSGAAGDGVAVQEGGAA